METRDLIELPASRNSDCEPSNASPEPANLEAKEDKLNREMLGTSKVAVENGDSQLLLAAEMDRDMIRSSSVLQVSNELNEITAVAEVSCFNSRIQIESGPSTVQDGSSNSSQKREGTPLSNSTSGVKKAKITVDEQQPSVHVTYNSLARSSKQKLEDLLQKWSEWHAQHCSSSQHGDEELESGELTYFPALRFGLDSTSAVSFWVDNQPGNKKFITLDSNSIPLYDRGYSLCLTSTDCSNNVEGGFELVDASRCFNCGSYSHSLKDCPKPRDNEAVNNARKQHKSRRNQNANSRNPTRYYQNSPHGKYDGLKPGVLDAKTRKLLGLGELDPPPWLKRMQEIGYPPGYLDPENDLPSGLVIFGDESKEEKEDGEILETVRPDSSEPPRKMSVEFPGINAPIPENADERRWTSGHSSFDSSRSRSHHRPSYSTESNSRGHYHERTLRDDGPPGCDTGFSPTISIYSQGYNDYDSSYRGNNLIGRSPSYGRSLSDRGRSPLVHESSQNHGSYSPITYPPTNVLFSPPSYGSTSSGRRDYDSRNEFDPNYLSHRKYDRHQHHSWR